MRRRMLVGGRVPMLALTVLVVGSAVTSALVLRDTAETADPFFADTVEIYRFDSLEEMVATSDMVVIGEVTGSGEGRVVGPPEAAITMREMQVSVESTLLGAESSEIAVETEGWGRTGQPMVVNGLDWPGEGESALFFLVQNEGDPSLHHLVNSQGLLRVEDGQVRPGRTGAEEGDPIADALVGSTVDEAIATVEAAGSRVEEEGIEPQQPIAGPDIDTTLVGEPVLVGTGTDGGGDWSFLVSESRSGVCYGLGYGDPPLETCFRGAESAAAAEAGLLHVNADPDVLLVLAPAGGTTVTVTGEGVERQADAVAIPVSQGVEGTAAAVPLDADTPQELTVVVSDSQGNELYRSTTTETGK